MSKSPKVEGILDVEISKEYGRFMVARKGAPGSPAVGRGRTMKEALGDFLIHYQDLLGINLTLSEEVVPTEMRRRQRELRQR